MWIFAIIFVAGAWYSYGKNHSVWKAFLGGVTALLIYFTVLAIIALITILTGSFSVALGATSPIATIPVSTSTSALSAIAKAPTGANQQGAGTGLAPSQQRSVTVGTLVPMGEDVMPTPTPGPLFETALPVPTKPPSDVVGFWNGHEWITYSDREVTFNYPNGWSPSVERNREDGMEIGSIGVAHEDQRFDVTWYLLEDDLLWMFQNRARYRDLTIEVTQLFEESLIEPYPWSWIAEHTSAERLHIGSWPTFSTYGHNLVIDGNWTDADIIATIGGVVMCGPNRVCVAQYGKVDRPYSSGDWDMLNTFMQGLSFNRDDTLPRYVLTRVPLTPTPRLTATPTTTPTTTPTATATATPTNIPVAAPTVATSPDPESNEWVPYRSELVAFDAMIPPDFHIIEAPDSDGGLGGSVTITIDPNLSGVSFMQIGVFAIYTIDEYGGDTISPFEIGYKVEQSLLDVGASNISGPHLTEVAGLSGVHFEYDLPENVIGQPVRAYRSTISNGTWLHDIEVIGRIEDEDTIRAYYEDFIASFVPHDSSAAPTPVPGRLLRPPRPPRR